MLERQIQGLSLIPEFYFLPSVQIPDNLTYFYGFNYSLGLGPLGLAKTLL